VAGSLLAFARRLEDDPKVLFQRMLSHELIEGPGPKGDLGFDVH
jgi:hypothetical protein